MKLLILQLCEQEAITLLMNFLLESTGAYRQYMVNYQQLLYNGFITRFHWSTEILIFDADRFVKRDNFFNTIRTNLKSRFQIWNRNRRVKMRMDKNEKRKVKKNTHQTNGNVDGITVEIAFNAVNRSGWVKNCTGVKGKRDRDKNRNTKEYEGGKE